MLRPAILLVLFALSVPAHAQTRPRSTLYQMPADVQPAGGGEQAKSTNYVLNDTIGEGVIGDSRSATYALDAGYRQAATSFLALSCSATVDLGTIALTGRRTGSGACTVTTDAEAGYALAWHAATATLNAGPHVIAAFTPTVPNTPSAWTVPAAGSAWGGRLRSASTDTAAEWGADGVSESWLDVGTTPRTIVTRTSATAPGGSTEILQFRAEVGPQAVQPPGVYQTSVTVTASAL